MSEDVILKEIEYWRPYLKEALSKEKYESLTYWQIMVEIAAIKQYRKDNPICPLLGF